ncbi:MAG: hypothetical protein AUK34_05990 [Ignavibacteria bacterium CG2_30_36_16]|nr:MAG: hypothetical protein AUK34_05990 [Ignavibacteria bacterium CG2_30_36_16]
MKEISFCFEQPANTNKQIVINRLKFFIILFLEKSNEKIIIIFDIFHLHHIFTPVKLKVMQRILSINITINYY